MSSVVRKQLMYTYLVLFKLLKLNENMKTIRQIGMTLLAIAWGVSSTSCSNDDENNNSNNPSQNPIENFNQGNMNFTEEAGEQTFTFTANTSWNVSVAETSGGTTWCTVSPASGEAGEQVVTVKVNANETYDDRSVSLTLKAGTEAETFVVTQKQRNALLLTSDKYEVDQKGGTIKVEVKANIDYTATISEFCKDWITETTDASRGLTTTTKSYQISANEDGEKREGTIVFSNGTLTETVHVYQAGGNIILLTENEYYADAAGEEITVELRSNCEYEVVMPSVDWIHEAASRAMSSHTLHYTIDPNETYDNREAIIIYKDKNNSTADTLTIIQAQKDAIVLTEKEYTVSPEGETIEVKLASNTEYTITIASYAQSWITEVEDTKTKALVDSKHYFKIAKSNSSSERKGTITFSNDKGISEMITVIQEKPILEITSGEEKQVTAKNQTLEVMLNANLDFNITTEADWINQIGITQNENGKTVTFSISENTESTPRSAEIVFSNEDFRLKESLTVTQQGKMVEVTVRTSGTLEQLVKDYDYRNIQSLKINGELNGTDIAFLHDVGKSYNLATLDLSNASIVSGGEPYSYESGALYTSDNEIGKYMFFQCKKLEKVILPNNVTKICDQAFERCENMTEITIPSSLKEIGSMAFYGTKILKVNISDLSAWCSININSSANLINNTGLYLNGQLLTDLNIPNGVISVGNSAFNEYNHLIHVTISNTVTEIGSEAFFNCYNLKEVLFGKSVAKIGVRAFSNCKSLTEVVIPNNVTELGQQAFDGCSNLVKISLPDGLTEIEGFSNCEKLIDIKIPNSVTKIGASAFKHCNSLTDITIPESVTEIGSEAFNGCTNLSKIVLPDNIAKIELSTFSNCSSLTDVSIGSKITEISQRAFYNIPLKNCHIYANTPPKISNDTFKFTNFAGTTLYVPKGCVQAYTDAGWGNYFYNIVEMDK